MALGGSIWSTLGVEPTNDEREVRRAYARRLKEVHPEDDPEGFQALREAYERAVDMARRGWAVPPARTRNRKKKAEPVTDAPSADTNWASEDADRWSEPEADAGEAWDDSTPERWDEAPPPEPPPVPELSPEVRAELEAEQKRQDAHTALCEELDALLRRTSAPSDEALSVMLRLFRSPAMDSLRVHANTEYWLASAIARGGPAADSLIEPAIRFFGWDDARIGLDLSHAYPVLRRREAAQAIAQLARPLTLGHDAWKALRAKQTPFRRLADRLDPFLSRQVADLLDRAAHDLPELQGHLDPDAVAAWRARFARPRFSAVFLLSLLILPPILSLAMIAAGLFGPATFPNVIAAWVAALAAMTGIGAAWIEGVLIPARKWRDGQPWSEPFWKRLGWAPAMVALVVIAPFFTAVDWLWPAVLLTGLGIAGWAKIVTSHIPAPPVSRYRIAEFVGVIPIIAYALVMPGSASQPSMLAALLCAVLTFRIGGHAISQAWSYADVPRQRKASAALLGGAAFAGATGVLSALAGVPGLAIGLVCGVAFADRALATSRFGPVFKLRRGWLLVGWIAALTVAGMVGGPVERILPIAAGVWLTFAGLLTGLAAFLPAPGQKRKKRRA
ncbi:hypothetical protein [Brevundimonas sp.]|uniref:J domain-containing protein n=1 Tax=Brevundimonas sp. TaxID=1871086 RepID=UPI003F71ECDF